VTTNEFSVNAKVPRKTEINLQASVTTLIPVTLTEVQVVTMIAVMVETAALPVAMAEAAAVLMVEAANTMITLLVMEEAAAVEAAAEDMMKVMATAHLLHVTTINLDMEVIVILDTEEAIVVAAVQDLDTEMKIDTLIANLKSVPQNLEA